MTRDRNVHKHFEEVFRTATYRTPRKTGLSPGAVHSDSFLRLMMWARAETVAATYHGRPRKEQIRIAMATTNKSRW